jgi:osmotically inducible protein OsmC
MNSALHSGEARVIGGRDGRATTPDGILDVPLRRQALSKPGEGTTPEALFAATYAACFSGALGRVRRERGLSAVTLDATCRVAVFSEVEGVFDVDVELDMTIPDTSVDDAVEQLRAAHVICPYSRAIRGNVPVTLRANGKLVE